MRHYSGVGRGRSSNNYNNRPDQQQQRRNYVPRNQSSNQPIAAEDPFEDHDETEPIEFNGILEMHPNGYGFLRSPEVTYTRRLIDPFVPGSMIEKYGLREGIMIRASIQPGRKTQGPRVREILEVEGADPDVYINTKRFEDLTPVTPHEWYQLETGKEPISTRVMDLLTPLGKGQRALIVAPPRTGKTILLQQISQAIATNYPEVKLFVLLIDERPEEVTDMKRAVLGGEVVASSLDRDIESHVRLSQLLIERAKRLTELGKDVFILLDSITRLARAFNKWVGNTGKTMSGGVAAEWTNLFSRNLRVREIWNWF